MKHVKIMGIPFTHIDHRTLVQKLETHIEQKEKSFVITANPEIVMRANEDHNYMRAIHKADYITADGIGIIKAAELFNHPLPGRVTGYDVMMDLLQISSQKKYRIYLLGAHRDTLEAAKRNIKLQYPHLDIVGAHEGYFDWDSNSISEEILQTRPDIIFVALGAPKQEKWIAENIHKFNHGIFLCVGGSLDVWGGKAERAPISWQNRNLEWLYRLLKQPRRWRRMLALPRFAYCVLRQKVKKT
ncbi:WecB/TagA/CpsF family glycosyltransferase [Halobacillus yeomjeoni]|uniref:WecB/TagA/CpsF family glycosyltransferase n=1 Tax=Halobacillus yeomjeoni TaxID=311194 RepID=UPI001CD4BF60|nr:WecB/TagA/CpsF family glycosyltransferase [Halobacillus yeomjeoni]MCA0985204.1 WecB/TagA/CpsF family glycosyltransferase [Halobacillus yeomjeoni]